jgi:hypothetical protein
MILGRQANPGRELRPERNSSGAGVFIISKAAPIGPTPGIFSETSAAFIGPVTKP